MRVEDYLGFFDQVYQNDPWLNTRNNPWWGICYCGFFDDTRSEDERNNAPHAAVKNRAMRAEMIRSGKANGLLAYVDGKVVGWCNAGPRTNYLNLHGYPGEINQNEPIGSILCFVVAAPFRGKGIGTALLNGAIDKFRGERLKVAEGYPRTIPADVNNPHNTPPEHLNYRGSLQMFLKAGFTIHRRLERHAIVRKKL
ncbi:MAG TPA: GNAT family N-acetyltransferase [Candidatus Bathyarchaeia archaeon]|nr:GNAT family N-acetyltransferase [Candidatus Bathyarchaeia archaeon]